MPMAADALARAEFKEQRSTPQLAKARHELLMEPMVDALP